MKPRTIARDTTVGASATRRLLLDAAAERFAAAGYNGVTIDELAERAGFTKGAFYVHFPDKESALLAVFEEWAAGRTLQSRRLAAGIVEGRAGAALAAFLEEAVADARACALELEFRSQAVRLQRLQGLLQDAEGDWKEILAARCGPALAGEILRLCTGLVAATAVRGRPPGDVVNGLAARLLRPRLLTAVRPQR